MALPTTLLIAIERLRRDHYTLLRHYRGLHAPIIDIGLIDSAIQQVALDRIAFAKEFVASATDMLAGSPDEMDFRNATSRGYYAVHHTLRAVLLFDLRADTYGHSEAISDFLKRMKDDPALKTKADVAGINQTTLKDLLLNRQLADYHYYGSSNPSEPKVEFASIGPQAVHFADEIVVQMEEYLQDRIAGKY